MTLNNFYLVLRETDGRAYIQDIGSRVTRPGADGFSGYEAPDPNEQNINFKQYTIVKRKKADGTIEYRGKAGLSWVSTLTEVEPGADYYFNHLD